ncbi:MAG TPA: DUF6036 family nucleotidyltransferase [Verrucomicrobiae bacterium]|nr:DUF6036 family nucleotidyltransferase [Verrucomicrobiae bacterium]
MNRFELEHIIRASSGITNQKEIVIVGSQSILGKFPNANQRLLVSMEADVFPLEQPQLSDQIDGAIGERSLFHQTFGYYAHGVSENTAVLPNNWKERLIAVQNQNTGGGTGLCLEPHDLAASKLAAGREKDLEFVQVMLSERMIQASVLNERIRTLPLSPDQLNTILSRLERIKAGDKNPSSSFSTD